MTIIDDLKALQGQFGAMWNVHTDSIFALGNLNDLKALLNKLEQVPGPMGDPMAIAAYALSLSGMAQEWATVRDDLVAVSTTRIPQAWSQSDAAADARNLITSFANDLADIITAFNTAAQIMDSWRLQLATARRNDGAALALIQTVLAEIQSVQNDAITIQNTTEASNPFDVSAYQLAGRLGPIWDGAAATIMDRLGAAQQVWDSATEAGTKLRELGTTGIPPGPNGQAKIDGAFAAFAGLGVPPPAAMINPVGDARSAADLIRLADSGQGLTPEQQTELATLLSQDENDPDFADALLNDLGPAAFLQFITTPTGKPLIDASAHVLATATSDTQIGSLAPGWLDQLHDAAGANGGAGYVTLGVLLADPNVQYGTAFLMDTGVAVVNYEIQNGGPDIWPKCTIDGSAAYDDPVFDLMVALQRNPAAANQFFTLGHYEDPYLPTSVGIPRPPVPGADPSDPLPVADTDEYGMVDYLLHRKWNEDHGTPTDLSDPNLYGCTVNPAAVPNPGKTAFGDALAAGTQNTEDPGNQQLAQYLVHNLGNPGTKIPDGMGHGLTQLTANYMKSGDIEASWSGSSGLFKDRDDVQDLVWNLSQDGDQAEQLTAATLGYTTTVLNSATPASLIKGHDVNSFATNTGKILGTIAQSNFQATTANGQHADDQANSFLSKLQQGIDAATNLVGPVAAVNQTGPSSTETITDSIINTFKTNTSDATHISAEQAYGQASSSFGFYMDRIEQGNPALVGISDLATQGFDDARQPDGTLH